MNKIKEKQLLVKWSKAMNEPIDPAIVEEVERYEQLQKEIIESVKQNSIRDLVEASAVAEQLVEKVNIEFPKPPTLDELLDVLKEETNELVQTQTTQEPTPAQETKTTSLAKLAAEHITKEVQTEQASFQQPNPPLVDKNLEAIQKKLKFLEQAIGKIAATGPGGGEVNLRWLDDVDRATIADNRYLKYNAQSQLFIFDTLDYSDIAGVYDYIQLNTDGPNITTQPGMLSWNPDEDCLDVTQNDGSILQVGLENYIRVYNTTGNTISDGTFVQFTGVDYTNDAPTVAPFVNNVDSQPLYAVGVTTTDITDNAYGRATVIGMVRGLNTTGNTVSETWQQGDILWASDITPGALTKFKPTAPNVAISVAAVINNDATDGKLLVRPSIWPRFLSGDFYSTQSQIAPNTNFAHTVTFSNTLFSSGITLSENTKIRVAQSGFYRFDVRLQLTSTNASLKSMLIWFRKNGENVPYSTVRFSTSENGGFNVVKNIQAISLDPTDYVTLHYAVDDTNLYIDSPVPFDGAANVSSVQLSVTQPSL